MFIRIVSEEIVDIQRYGVRLSEENLMLHNDYITQFIYKYNNKEYLIIKMNGEVVTALQIK